jgi:hypothetical protein
MSFLFLTEFLSATFLSLSASVFFIPPGTFHFPPKFLFSRSFFPVCPGFFLALFFRLAPEFLSAMFIPLSASDSSARSVSFSSKFFCHAFFPCPLEFFWQVLSYSCQSFLAINYFFFFPRHSFCQIIIPTFFNQPQSILFQSQLFTSGCFGFLLGTFSRKI